MIVGIVISTFTIVFLYTLFKNQKVPVEKIEKENLGQELVVKEKALQETKRLTDGSIERTKLYHNTWDELYRKPFGAVPTDTEIRLRLQTVKGDVSSVTVLFQNIQTREKQSFPMILVEEKDIEGSLQKEESFDYWEADLRIKEIGAYDYQFVVEDQDMKVDYKQGNRNFRVTVYDPEYTTPNWMKEAVVYQIFPDRFLNGNASNDKVKINARGNEPIEYRSFIQLPDNPNIKEKDRTEEDGDGIWGNDFFGGDIAGIYQKLDYLQSLGVNTLYLNPIAYAASNHKYDATDFKTLDPMFGTEEEFKVFTEELRKRNMYLIVDGVFNHVGDDSIYFDRYGKYETVGAYEYWSRVYDKMNDHGLTQEIAETQVKEEFITEGQRFSEFEFHNWFHIENRKVDQNKPWERYWYQSWWNYDSLPEFKSMTGEEAISLGLAKNVNVGYPSEYNNQRLVDYIFKDSDSVAKTWLRQGATGWRLDVANEIDPEFWRAFRKELKDPTFQKELGYEPLILGEIWEDATIYFLGDQYDSVMNYRFRDAVIDFLRKGQAENTDGILRSIMEDYPTEAFYALMNLLGSHDTARALFILGDGADSHHRAENDSYYNEERGLERLKLAALFQMGYPGAPTIYYGDEAGLTGSSDPDCRRPYPWGEENKDLIKYYQQLGQIRSEYKNLLAYGSLFTLYAQGDIYIYGRQYEEQIAIVAINRGTTDQVIEVNIPSHVSTGFTLIDGLDKNYQITVEGEKLSFHIPAMRGRFFHP